MNPRERHILAVTCFGHFISHFNMLVFPALLLPLSASLGLDLAQTLSLSLWQYLLFGVSALPWGLASDRFGAKPVLMLFFLGAGGFGLAAAFWVDTSWALSLCLAGVGLFSGAYHPAGLGLVARGVKRISLGMAYNGIFGNLGLGAAPLVTGLAYWLWGTAAAFMVMAGLNLAGFVLMAFIKVEEPARQTGSKAKSTRGLLGPFLILLAATTMAGFTYRGMTVTLPAYLELQVPQILAWLQAWVSGAVSGNLAATITTSAIFTLGGFAQFGGGWVGERVDPRWGYFAFHAITAPAAFLMAWASDLPLVAAALVYTFFQLGSQPLENTLISRFSPPAMQHTAYGVKFVLTFGVGALSVELAGLVEKTWGLASVYTGIGMVALCILACILLLIWRTQPAWGQQKATPSQ